MSANSMITSAKQSMEKCRDFLVQELRGVRSGRASTGLVDTLRVEVASYGSSMPLKELASLAVADGNTIVVKPYDPSVLKDIAKAIEKSDIGINPQNDGKVVRLPVPPLSTERRNQMAQRVKQLGEAQKIAVRNIRRDANKAIDGEKNKSLSEDEVKKAQDEIQKMTDDYCKKIDDLVAEKSKEVMED
ncbi:MAG: ribosome recycling factor [Phycisphaerae bacterium]